MAFVTADRVMETTATAGTGALALGGAVTTDGGYVTFASKMNVADTCEYCIRDSSTTAWEVGLGTYSATSTLTRTTVYASSNANAAVAFAGNATTVVFLTLPASRAAGFAPLASPAFTGATTITGTVTGTAIVAAHAAPGPLGNTTASTGAFTTLSATTPTTGDSSTAAATTAFVSNANDGVVTIGVTGGPLTLTAAQYGVATLLFTGTLTSNSTITVPNAGVWTIANRTTGAFTLTIKTAAGAGDLVSQGFNAYVAADGVNVIDVHTDYNASTITGSTINSTAIGATAASSGAFTTLSATGLVSGAGIVAVHASPGPLGSTAASTGAFTTLSATGAVSGVGFTGLVGANALDYIVSTTQSGIGSATLRLLIHYLPHAITLPASLTGSGAVALTAATASAAFVFAYRRLGVTTTIATFTFAAAGTVASISGVVIPALAAGDLLLMTGPAVADTTLADVGFTVLGIKQ